MHDNLSVGSWIARRATPRPDRTAVIFRDRKISYRELDNRIRRLAGALASAGVGKGDRVACASRNEPAAIEGPFACGLLGAVATLVPPELDGADFQRILEDVRPRALVAIERPDSPSYETVLAQSAALSAPAAVGLDDLCLLARSSGTSGPSKGIELTHGNLLFNALNLLSRLDFASDDVILTSTPLYRMGAWGFLLPVLLKGGTCVLEERPSSRESLRLIERHRVTVLFDSVPALHALVREPEFETAELGSLRICATGGSRVPGELVESFRRRGLRLHAGYGLSEAAPVVALTDHGDASLPEGNVGFPLPLCSVRVVDTDLRDVSEGATGEVLIHGPNVMRGYTDPAATARAFVDGGWLRTGDAGRFSADGSLSILGRVADALTVAGRTLHPEPVEAELQAEAGVAECLLVQEAPEAPVDLCFVERDGAGVDESRLLAACRRLLDGARLRLRRVERLPKNRNGKPVRGRMRRILAEAT